MQIVVALCLLLTLVFLIPLYPVRNFVVPRGIRAATIMRIVLFFTMLGAVGDTVTVRSLRGPVTYVGLPEEGLQPFGQLVIPRVKGVTPDIDLI